MLSVIIPAYNVEKTIEECVQSILSQNIEGIEVIIVDDGSKDRTLAICKELADEYECVKVYHQENQGVSVARNLGIAQANGEWILFVDGDDGLQADCLSKINFNTTDDVILCGHKRGKIDESGSGKTASVEADFLARAVLDLAGNWKTARQLLVLDNYSNWACWGKFFRREIIQTNHLTFSKGITHGEDLIFCYKYYCCAQKALCIDLNLYFYRESDGSVSRRFNPRRIENTEKLFDALIEADAMRSHDSEFSTFVVNRLVVCVTRYYALKDNQMSEREKELSLSELCQNVVVNRALRQCNVWRLTLGTKVRVKSGMIAQLLCMKRYKWAIKIASIL